MSDHDVARSAIAEATDAIPQLIDTIENAVAMGIGIDRRHVEIAVMDSGSRGYSAALIVSENVERICRKHETPEAAVRALYRKVRTGMKKRARLLNKAAATMTEISR